MTELEATTCFATLSVHSNNLTIDILLELGGLKNEIETCSMQGRGRKRSCTSRYGTK
jgi:hypothetical protein